MIFTSAWLAASLFVAVEPPCQPVDGEHITTRDLAIAEPRLVGPDPEQELGFAPEPGAKRIFWPAELLRIADRNSLEINEPLHQICFERRAKPLTEAEIVSAIRAWAPESAQVTVVEQSQTAAPLGTLVLPRPAIVHSAHDGSVLLHGYVVYGSSRRFPTWARVRFRVDREVAVATEAINAGSEIREDQIRMEPRSGGIEATDVATGLAQVAGRITVRHLAPGDPISLASLLKPKQVNSGSIVRVEVHDGATRLSLDGRAETSGRTGDLVTIRNPASGKSFQARVVGEDAVLVVPSGVHGEGKI